VNSSRVSDRPDLPGPSAAADLARDSEASARSDETVVPGRSDSQWLWERQQNAESESGGGFS
jgi:hypothetical protein